MKGVTIQEAIDDLSKIFIKRESLSRHTGNGCFMIDKREFERFETIEKLQQYFSDKFIIDGQCRIESITLLWTVFHIEPREKDNRTSPEE